MTKKIANFGPKVHKFTLRVKFKLRIEVNAESKYCSAIGVDLTKFDS